MTYRPDGQCHSKGKPPLDGGGEGGAEAGVETGVETGVEVVETRSERTSWLPQRKHPGDLDGGPTATTGCRDAAPVQRLRDPSERSDTVRLH